MTQLRKGFESVAWDGCAPCPIIKMKYDTSLNLFPPVVRAFLPLPLEITAVVTQIDESYSHFYLLSACAIPPYSHPKTFIAVCLFSCQKVANETKFSWEVISPIRSFNSPLPRTAQSARVELLELRYDWWRSVYLGPICMYQCVPLLCLV